MRPRLLLFSISLMEVCRSKSSWTFWLFTGGRFIVRVAIPVLSLISTVVSLVAVDINLLGAPWAINLKKFERSIFL